MESQQTQSTQALAKSEEKTPAVITTPAEYADAMKRWEGNYNVLTPFTMISGLAPQHGIQVTRVQIDSNPAPSGPQEVYDGLPFLKRGEVALAKRGLRKIAECAGISVSTFRMDPRTIQHYWEFKAVATYRGVDGAIVTREATAEWDLRDGSPRLKGWQENQVSEGRKNGLRNCETRAINAVIRECGCGLKQKYTVDELRRPFIVLRVMFTPDMSDPETRRLVTERALQGTAMLYSRPALGEGGGAKTFDVDAGVGDGPRPIGRGSSEAASEPALPDGYGAIRDLRSEKAGNKTKRTVVDYAGAEHITTNADVGDSLQRLFQAKTPVEIVSELNDYDEHSITEVNPLSAQPSLLPDPAKL